VKCPQCGSSEILRVHAHGFEKILRKLLGFRFYSCQDCDWNGTGLSGIRIFLAIAVFVLKVGVAALVVFLALYLFRMIR